MYTLYSQTTKYHVILVEGAEMEKEHYSYSWTDGNGNYTFMHSATFEEVQVPREDLEFADFLLEGLECKLLKFKGKVIGAELPRTYEYEVVKIDAQKTRYALF